MKLSITIGEDHIKGSPYTITVHQDYKTVNKPRKIVNDNGEMGYPWAIAFGKDGVWAATDESYRCVSIFDSQDKLIRKFGQYGTVYGTYLLQIAGGGGSN